MRESHAPPQQPIPWHAAGPWHAPVGAEALQAVDDALCETIGLGNAHGSPTLRTAPWRPLQGWWPEAALAEGMPTWVRKSGCGWCTILRALIRHARMSPSVHIGCYEAAAPLLVLAAAHSVRMGLTKSSSHTEQNRAASGDWTSSKPVARIEVGESSPLREGLWSGSHGRQTSMPAARTPRGGTAP